MLHQEFWRSLDVLIAWHEQISLDRCLEPSDVLLLGPGAFGLAKYKTASADLCAPTAATQPCPAYPGLCLKLWQAGQAVSPR